MSELNQLPLKFKLFQKGEHVGYEDHFLNPAESQIEIFHVDMKGKTGRILYGFYIPHDEKRLSTGFHDVHGEEIYFLDILSHPAERPDLRAVVQIAERGIYADDPIEENTCHRVWSTSFFKEMELVK